MQNEDLWSFFPQLSESLIKRYDLYFKPTCAALSPEVIFTGCHSDNTAVSVGCSSMGRPLCLYLGSVELLLNPGNVLFPVHILQLLWKRYMRGKMSVMFAEWKVNIQEVFQKVCMLCYFQKRKNSHHTV